VLEKIVLEAKQLSPVSLMAAQEYNEKKEFIIEQVNQELKNHPTIISLIGQKALGLMLEGHSNHAKFMANIFRFNCFEVLAKNIIWVLRSYKARGFSYAYFPIAWQAWSDAVEEHLEPAHALMIKKIYSWMQSKYQEMALLAQVEITNELPSDPAWQEIKDKFFAALLKGEYKECLLVAMKEVNTSQKMEDFYVQVIQPSMYDIGYYWERGEISVAQEHLASIIVSRVMTALYPRFMVTEQTKGIAVVTAAPNEYHELGALMVADLLEIDGWEVKYLGANTPEEDLLNFLRTTKPLFLGISVCLFFNLEKAAEIIAAMKKDSELEQIKIMVGGLAFDNSSELAHNLGADGWAPNAKEAVVLAREWWEKKGSDC